MKKLFLIYLLLLFLFTNKGQNSVAVTTRVFTFNSSPLKLLQESMYVLPTYKKNYSVVQSFANYTEKRGTHLGIDINKKGTKNCELGEPIFAITNSYVNAVNGNSKGYLSTFGKLKGNIVRIVYLHCDTILVKEGQYLRYGDMIARIGNDEGYTTAHLHLEIMSDTTKWFGGYGDVEGYIDPSTLIPNY